MKKRLAFPILSFLLVMSFLTPAYAKITLNSDFEGTVVITLPDGEISLIEPGDPIPDIPSGSVIEVFDGQFIVAAEEGDQVGLMCLDHGISIGGGGSANLSCGEESGLLKVIDGTARATDLADKETNIPAGTEYPIQAKAEETAEPTAATDPTGLPLAEDTPVDSRSIQTSPS